MDPWTVDASDWSTNILTVSVIVGCQSHRWWIFKGGRKSVKELRKLLNGNKWSKNKLKTAKITHYLQYLGSKLNPLDSQTCFSVVVKVAHCQQVGTAGSKRQGYTNKWNASVHIDCIT